MRFRSPHIIGLILLLLISGVVRGVVLTGPGSWTWNGTGTYPGFFSYSNIISTSPYYNASAVGDNITDSVFNSPTVFNNALYNEILSLEYTRQNKSDIDGNSWQVVVIVQISASGYTSQLDTLTISDQNYRDVRLNTIPSPTWTVTIQSAHVYGTLNSAIQNDIRLIPSSQLTYYRGMTGIPVTFPGSSSSMVGNELEMRWNGVTCASEYELQYVFIDSTDINYSIISANPTYAFDYPDPTNPVYTEGYNYKEPVNIVQQQTSYRIHNSYPSGILFYRVRPLGNMLDNTNVVSYGNWSSVGQYNFTTSFERYMIWQDITSFAEEGKHKEIISYYDGSMRKRQAITNFADGSNGQFEPFSVVAETKYDYEGRGVFTLLPAPVDTNIIAYHTFFNQNATGEYTKDNFDKINNTPADPLSFSHGAGFYYSAGVAGRFISLSGLPNPAMNYVPIDSGYSFSQVAYMRDGTGRVAATGGVGSHHQIGSGHETRYLYGTTTATELHRMFGSNVGNAAHYKKNYTIDPNGQVSVTYLDQESRTIATALAGAAPANVQSLSENVTQSITENLMQNNTVDTANRISSLNYQIVNVVPNTTYSFTYNLTGVINSLGTACKTCVYQLNIYIAGPDGNLVSLTVGGHGSTMITDTIQDGSLSSCSTTSFTGSAVTFSATLANVGTYSLTKTLLLTSGTIQAYMNWADSISGTWPDSAAIAQTYLSQVDSSICDLSCTGAYKGTCTQQLSQTPGWGSLTTAVQQQMIQNCITAKCNGMISQGIDSSSADQCASYLEQMKQSIIPGQQGSVNYNWWATATPPPFTIDTPNPSGIILTITTDTLADSTYFQSWYADSLVRYHREYCHYTACVGRITADIFQDQLGLIDGLQAAEDSTFTPTGPTYYKIITGYNQASVDSDPLFGPGGECSAYAVAMYDSLQNVMQCGTSHNIITNYYLFTTGWAPCNNSLTDTGSNATIFYPGLNSPANDSTIQGRYWQLMKGCYINFRQKFIKLAEQGSCPYFTDTNAIVTDPTGNMPTNQTSLNTAMAQQQQNATPYQQCEANITGWKWTVTDACGISDTAYDLYVAPHLFNYCIRHCNEGNPLGLIYFSDTATDADLSSVHTYLAGCDSNIETINPYAYTSQANYASRDTATGLPGNTAPGFSAPIVTTTITVAPCIQGILNYVNNEMVSKCSSGYWGQCGQVYRLDSTAQLNYPDVADCLGYTNNDTNYRFAVYMPSSGGSYLTLADYGKGSACAYTISFFDTTGTLITDVRTVNNLTVQSTSPGGNTRSGSSFTPDSLYYIFHSPIIQVTTLPACAVTYTGLSATIQRQGSPSSVTGWMYVTAYDITASSTGTCDTSASCKPAFTVTITDTVAQGYSDSATANQGSGNYPGYEDTCLAQLQAQATYYATQKYDSAYEATSGTILAALNKCFDNPFAEDFYVSYTQQEYHYTLYYYDQGGNLVQTVPPAGFDGTGATFSSDGTWSGSSPNHRLKSRYRHNSLQKVRWQLTPDADSSNYWYDDRAMLKVSQNAKQRHKGLYSFTTYDGQARIVSVGEIKAAGPIALSRGLLDQSNYLQNFQPAATLWNNINDYTLTIYDFVLLPGLNTNVRNRVSWSARNTGSGGSAGIPAETYYGYDTHGNVSQLQQWVSNLPPKLITYNYDLISGKVDNVYYYNEAGTLKFTHRYSYDADNRVINVQTSKTGIIYDNDANYYYYPHGPLARLELGQDQVQGLDYYYTVQGWLKGINAVNDTLFSGKDPGLDGVPGLHPHFAQDDYSLVLSYYQGDYQQAGGTTLPFTTTGSWGNYSSNILGNGLYNGNITWQGNSIGTGMTVSYSGHPFINGPVQTMAYEYDQLNRIKNSAAYDAGNGTSQSGSAPYLEQYGYDQNGNITTLVRKNDASTTIDNLTYHYDKESNGSGTYFNSNRLYRYDDASSDATPNTLQPPGGSFDANNATINTDNIFSYDSIGNLVYDSTQDIENIKWDVYGKIESITRKSGSSKSDLQFAYDHGGNRVVKIVIPKVSGAPAAQSQWVYTYYIRDAGGNVIDAITSTGAVAPYADEFTLYGSSRLGTWTPASPVAYKGGWLNSYGNDNRIMSNKVYELTNHLGNVMETVSDKKLGMMRGLGFNPITDYYIAQVMSANDYYNFGSLMPGRQYTSINYRYGFNGQEKSDEIAGLGNSMSAEFWQYDSRLARRWNIDPVVKVDISSYATFNDNPVIWNDPNGDDPGKLEVKGDEKEGQKATTEATIPMEHGGTMTVTQDWYWHAGSKGHEAGWYTAADYYSDILKPVAKDYNDFKAGKSNGDAYFGFVYDAKRIDNDWGATIHNIGAYVKANPSYDGWKSIMPVWGSGNQAALDFSVGKYGWGTFNAIMAVSDVMLIKSAFTGIGKAIFKEGIVEGTTKYFGIGMSHEYGASVARWKNLGLDVSGFKHHWLLSQELMEKYPMLKPIGNQLWNLKQFETQAAHMRWAHGQMYKGISYPFTELLYPITSTPVWLKYGAFSAGGRSIGFNH